MKQEIRLAVVMYGGVSLAIYMNGVAQELLSVVRATKEGMDEADLSATESIYRKLGYLLHSARKPGEDDGVAAKELRTCVVIDLLSGTSAGGINAVFLAKALATGARDLEVLRRMWLEEADIDTLLNDEKSEPRRYRSNPDKTSLLNSQRMYGKLLAAFRALNPPDDSAGTSGANEAPEPHVEHLELFVTATDLNGIASPIELANTVVDEKVHKFVFRFAFDKKAAKGGPAAGNRWHHFRPDFDPMLAFAARCTSSFPTAFEPVRYSDMVNMVEEAELKSDLFEQFFQRYTLKGVSDSGASNGGPERLGWKERQFADGGYLDNKPFSYVVDRIPAQPRGVPLERKLLYVDPFPEYRGPDKREFSFVENTLMAASGLPRYETIRADIDRINAENRERTRRRELRSGIIDTRRRCARLTRGGPASSKGKTEIGEADKKTKAAAYDNYEENGLENMVQELGTSYASYHHLKVADATKRIASLLARGLGLLDESDLPRAVTYLVESWRKARYSTYKEAGKETENRFLMDFDYAYRLRKVDRLMLCLEDNDYLKDTNERFASTLSEKDFQDKHDELSQALAHLREKEAALVGPAAPTNVREALERLAAVISVGDLKGILEQTNQEDKRKRADSIREARSAEFENLAEQLACAYRETFTSSQGDVGKLVRPVEEFKKVWANQSAPPSARRLDIDPEKTIRRALWEEYLQFEDLDMTTFAFLSGTDAREESIVEVFRVGPEDASWCPRQDDHIIKHKGDKLAGTSLGAFGGFLEKGWRENDIMWGRLDGAERIVTALLPHPDDAKLREKYVEDLHKEILSEKESEAMLLRWLKGQLAGGDGGSKGLEQKALEALKTRERDPLAVLKAYYTVPPGPPPQRALEWSARAARILSEMVDALGTNSKATVQPSALSKGLRLAATLVINLVRFSLPQELLTHVFQHWLRLVALAGTLLIVVGPLTGTEVGTIGWVTLAVTLLLAMLTWLLRGWFRSRKVPTGLLWVVAILAPIGLGVAGGWGAHEHGVPLSTILGCVVAGMTALSILASPIPRWIRTLGIWRFLVVAVAIILLLGLGLAGGWFLGAHGVDLLP